MSSFSQGGSNTAIIFLAILVLLIIRRVYRSYRGVKFGVGRTIGYTIFYIALGSIFSVLSFFEGVPLIFALPYGVLLFAAAFGSYRYTDKRISFWRGADDDIYFKGGVVLYIIYVVGLVARLSIEFAFFGTAFFVPTTTSALLTSTDLNATIATDLLMMFGLGLLAGRNVRVLVRARRIQRGDEVLSDSPPPSERIFGTSARADEGDKR